MLITIDFNDWIGLRPKQHEAISHGGLAVIEILQLFTIFIFMLKEKRF